MTHQALAAALIALLLALAAGAHAQQMIATELDVTVTPPGDEADSWEGQPITGTLDVALCWEEAGGTNYSGGSFHVEVTTAGTPDWVSVEVQADALEFTPPTGPTTESGCTETQMVTITLESPDSVQPDETFEVEFALTVSQEGDPGTFQAPEDASGGFFVTTVAGPGTPPGDGDDGDDGNDEDGDNDFDDENPNENDTPAPGAVVLLGFIGAALVLRRLRK